MKILLRFVNDDWEELEVDGTVVVEGHTISAWQMLQAFSHVITEEEPDCEQVYRCNFCEQQLPDEPTDHKYLCSDCKECE